MKTRNERILLFFLTLLDQEIAQCTVKVRKNISCKTRSGVFSTYMYLKVSVYWKLSVWNLNYHVSCINYSNLFLILKQKQFLTPQNEYAHVSMHIRCMYSAIRSFKKKRELCRVEIKSNQIKNSCKLILFKKICVVHY